MQFESLRNTVSRFRNYGQELLHGHWQFHRGSRVSNRQCASRIALRQENRYRDGCQVRMLPVTMMNRETTAFDFLEFAIQTFALVDNRVMFPIHLRQRIQNHSASRDTGVRKDAGTRRGVQYRHSVATTEIFDRERAVFVGVFPNDKVDSRDCRQRNRPFKFFGDASHKRTTNMRDMIFIGEAITERANFSRDSKALICLMLVDHTFLCERLENSVDGSSGNFQFAGKLGRANAISPI